MQRFLPVFMIGFFSLIFCCNSSEDQEIEEVTLEQDTVDSTDYEVIEKQIKEEQRTEIYTIKGKAVVFFVITKNEVKELMNEIGDSYRWETESLFNNFTKQYSTFQSLLKKHNIKCELSTSKKFEIQLKNGKIVQFDRIEHDQIIGEIITDGVQEPRIDYGMYSDKELAKLIQDFFKIQSIGYIPTDTLAATEEPGQEP